MIRGIKKSLISIMLSFFMFLSSATCVQAKSPGRGEELADPAVCYDFENEEVGTELLNGKVEEYRKNKTLKLELDAAGRANEFYVMEVGEVAFSFDIAVPEGSIEGNMKFESGNMAGTALQIHPDGYIKSYNGREVVKYGPTMQRVTVVFKPDRQHFDIYVNNKLSVPGVYTRVRFDKIVNVELYFRCAEGTADIFVDNIIAYPTYVKTRGAAFYHPENAPTTDKQVVLTDKTWFSDDSAERGFMSDKTSVHLRSGVVCKKGKKITLKNMPYESEKEIMVPAEFFEYAYDLKIVRDGDTILLGKKYVASLGSNILKSGKKEIEMSDVIVENEGVLYLPLRSLAEHVLKKKVTLDKTAIHSGLVILSDGEVDLPTGDSLQELNNFCFYVRPTKEQWLADYNASPLKGKHPRVMATQEDFDRIREEIKTNERKAGWFKNLISYCDARLEEPPLEYDLRDGIRLMYVSDDFMNWVTCYAMAYKLTGDIKYFNAAWKQIEAVAAFPDWNPIHHIDVGIMALGFGVAYDWFYDVLTPEQRSIMEKCVYNNLYWIINEAHESINTVYGDAGMQDNHNVYCNAGVIACVIAFMDIYPEIGSQIGANTVRLLERFLWLFAPNGAYFEGPSYAGVSINYTTRLFAAMETTMGTLYGMDKAEAFDMSGDYIMNMQSDVKSYGFGDGDSALKRIAGILWLYKHYGIKGRQDAVANLMVDATAVDAVYALLNYDANENVSADATTDLTMYYPGEDIVVARNSNDPGQVFAGLKATGTIHAHSHLDSGSFIFDAMGTRWAHDLGADDYNLEWEWGFYDIFRRRSESHNTLLITPDAGYGYELTQATLLSYDIKPKGVIVKSDMTKLYGDKVFDAKRGFFFTDDRRSLVVRDEVNLSKKADMYWLMYIDSEAEIIDDNTVILTKKNNPSQKLKVEFLTSGPKGTIGIEDAVPFPTSPQIPNQNKNAGYKRLYYNVVASGEVSITAKLTPYGFVGSDISKYNVDMDTWQIPEGKLNAVPELDSLTIDGESYSTKNVYIMVRVPTPDSPIPKVVAETSKYKMDIHYSKSIDDPTVITLTDPEDESNVVTYYITFAATLTEGFVERVFDDYTALNMQTVKASATLQEENPPEAVLDGNLATRWVSEYNAWLMTDLGSEQEFDTIMLAMYLATTRTHTFTVSISSDGENYTQVGTYTNSGTSDDYEAFDIGAQKARYVRLGFRGANNGESYNSVTEFVVAKKK